jgi:DNA-binding CsgD family transcriptional regulator
MPSVDESLLGRDAEMNLVRSLLADMQNGTSASIVVQGDPGAGKTALLDHISRAAGDARVVRIQGIESETQLPYAGIQWLISSFGSELDKLPGIQRAAVLTATGQAGGPPPSSFLVGLGLLSMLAGVAEPSGLVCLVDDAQWLDAESADVLSFVARRLDNEGVVMIFATRSDAGADFSGVRRFELPPLDASAALALLRRSAAAPLDAVVAQRIAAAAAGNPLGIIELGSGLSEGQLAGTDPLPDEPIMGLLKRHYTSTISTLKYPTRMWLVLAAAEREGRLDYIERAARILDLPAAASEEAENARIVAVGTHVAFRHPLIRSAAYSDVSSVERRRVHEALAAVTDQEADSDKRAWHLAAGLTGVHEEVAQALEEAADRARERGGYFAQAAFLRRAAELTPDPLERHRRLMDAAEVSAMSGQVMQTARLIEGLRDQDLDEITRGRLVLVSSSFAVMTGDPNGMNHAVAECLQATRYFEGRDTSRAKDALLQAFAHSFTSMSMTVGATSRDLVEHLERIEIDAKGSGLQDALLAALGAAVSMPLAEAAPTISAGLARLLDADTPPADLLRYTTLGHSLATAIWDNDRGAQLMDAARNEARRSGAVRLLWTLTTIRSIEVTEIGQLKSAAAYEATADGLADALGMTGPSLLLSRNLELKAWRGDDDLDELIEAILGAANYLGYGAIETLALNARAIKAISTSNYELAYRTHSSIRAKPHLTPIGRLWPDYIESAALSGHLDEAAQELRNLSSLADASPTAWSRGLAARGRALVNRGPEAEAHYLESVAVLSESDAVGELARSHMLFGEWLRRRRRRNVARTHLERALNLFEEMGAREYARRVRRELQALGVTSSASVAPPDAPEHDLTPREIEVAHRAAAGATNVEIGASMLISPNTVDYHLRKVFRKLDVSSRRQLASLLSTFDITP